MANSVGKLLSGPILDFFRLGQRRVLLFPVVGIPALWIAIRSLRDLSPGGTLGDPFFVLGSLGMMAVCCGVYIYRTRGPDRENFQIVVANFHAVGGRKAREEAITVRDRLIEELRARSLNQHSRVRIDSSREVIDGRTIEGRRRAEVIAMESRAHMVIGGTIRIDEEYLFEPFIVTRFSHPFEVSLGDARPAIIQPGQTLNLKRQKVSFEAGLAAFITALASIDADRYTEADQILAKLEDLGGVAWFYRGFSLLQLGKPKDAFDCFKAAYTFDKDFADAWLYAAFALRALGEDEMAKTHLQQASAKSGGVSLFHTQLRRDALRRMQELLIAELEQIKAASDRSAEMERTLRAGAVVMLRSTAATEFWAEGFKLLQEKKYDAAIDPLLKATDLDPESAEAWSDQALAFARLGRANETRAALRQAEVARIAQVKSGFYTDDERSRAHRDYDIAVICAIIGDKGPMIAHLNRAIDSDKYYQLFAKNEPDFAPYQNDVEFTKLINRDAQSATPPVS